MAEFCNDHIENLRKKCQTLLMCINNNSKKLDREIRKLHSQNIELHKNYGNKLSAQGSKKKQWEIRNNSSQIREVLCPDHLRNNPGHFSASVPDMTSCGKILIKSKKCSKNQQSYAIHRKPIKECYCYPEVTRYQQQQSKEACEKSNLPHSVCKSNIELRPEVGKDNRRELSPSISCETLRRVQRIDYSPRSQFLRNVQSKVSVLRNSPAGDCLPNCFRSPCYHKFMAGRKTASDEQTKVTDSCTCKTKNKSSLSELPIDSDVDEERKANTEEEDDISRRSGKRVLSWRTSAKKSILSEKASLERRKEKSTSAFPSKNKKIQACVDCPCCCRNQSGKSSDELDRNIKAYHTCPQCCQTEWKQKYDKSAERLIEVPSCEDLRNLRKFREQNYFDTHGSSQNLVSSPRSSCSLQQYLLNERLFAEPVRRFHRNDLVVTMPPCATVQKKRIHYFPRYIVRQEKSPSGSHHRRKRCQSCPLTGHAIDLGVLKTRPPLNSLALKYQKRV